MATVEKMTIHKALCELKILDSRINNAISSARFCLANKHSNEKVNGGYCRGVSGNNESFLQ